MLEPVALFWPQTFSYLERENLIKILKMITCVTPFWVFVNLKQDYPNLRLQWKVKYCHSFISKHFQAISSKLMLRVMTPCIRNWRTKIHESSGSTDMQIIWQRKRLLGFLTCFPGYYLHCNCELHFTLLHIGLYLMELHYILSAECNTFLSCKKITCNASIKHR